jgi:hypothetical protein
MVAFFVSLLSSEADNFQASRLTTAWTVLRIVEPGRNDLNASLSEEPADAVNADAT